MNIDEPLFRGLLQELVDENPFAIRAVLRILGLEFTDTVPTLAVTCAERPVLKVNLGFLQDHCATEDHVKAVICHEFLHVLLRHTEERRELTPARHLAFDAVINAIIHRQMGPGYSGMMARYYGNVRGLQRLLRPMDPGEETGYRARQHDRRRPLPQWTRAWAALYEGRLVADDIEALAQDCAGAGSRPGAPTGDLLGNHEELGGRVDGELAEALEQAMREMNGEGIWRSPKSRGVGRAPLRGAVQRQQRAAAALEARHPRGAAPARHARPALARAARRAAGLPHPGAVGLRPAGLPAGALAAVPARGPVGRHAVPPGRHRAGLPRRVRFDECRDAADRRPAVSALPAHPPAVLGLQRRGRASEDRAWSVAGRDLRRHPHGLRDRAPRAHPPQCRRGGHRRLHRAAREEGAATRRRTRLHAIVTRDGSPFALARAGIPYTQLGRLPS
jgi:hypothetical protein